MAWWPVIKSLILSTAFLDYFQYPLSKAGSFGRRCQDRDGILGGNCYFLEKVNWRWALEDRLEIAERDRENIPYIFNKVK